MNKCYSLPNTLCLQFKAEPKIKKDSTAYLNMPKFSNPGTLFIRTFDLGIQYFTMASNIRENLK